MRFVSSFPTTEYKLLLSCSSPVIDLPGLSTPCSLLSHSCSSTLEGWHSHDIAHVCGGGRGQTSVPTKRQSRTHYVCRSVERPSCALQTDATVHFASIFDLPHLSSTQFPHFVLELYEFFCPHMPNPVALIVLSELRLSHTRSNTQKWPVRSIIGMYPSCYLACHGSMLDTQPSGNAFSAVSDLAPLNRHATSRFSEAMNRTRGGTMRRQFFATPMKTV